MGATELCLTWHAKLPRLGLHVANQIITQPSTYGVNVYFCYVMSH